MLEKRLVTITQRAALQRINRVLSKDWRKVFKARAGSGAEHNCGRYYEVCTYKNEVKNTFIDLQKYGLDLKVIAEYEEVEK